MILFNFMHYFWRFAKFPNVKVRLATLASLAETLRTLSKSSKLNGRPILAAAWAHSSRCGIIDKTKLLIPSLSFPSPGVLFVPSSLRNLFGG